MNAAVRCGKGGIGSALTEEENYVLACYRYIELNPVRAQMVDHPGGYRWSSYSVNGQGESSRLITPHPVYERLRQNEADRQMAYRELFRHSLDPGMVDEIRRGTNKNLQWVAGISPPRWRRLWADVHRPASLSVDIIGSAVKNKPWSVPCFPVSPKKAAANSRRF